MVNESIILWIEKLYHHHTLVLQILHYNLYYPHLCRKVFQSLAFYVFLFVSMEMNESLFFIYKRVDGNDFNLSADIIRNKYIFSRISDLSNINTRQTQSLWPLLKRAIQYTDADRQMMPVKE